MLKISILTPLAFLVYSFCAAQADEVAIKACFKGYKDAIMEGRGKDAASYVDQNTIDYYTHILDETLHADSVSVADANMIDKIAILMVRHRISKETLETMDGYQFFVFAIDQGMVGKNSVVALELADINVEDLEASAQVASNGTPAPMYFDFYKIDALWKIDITSIFKESIEALNQMLDYSGQSENDFIFQALERLTGRSASVDIWQPM